MYGVWLDLPGRRGCRAASPLNDVKDYLLRSAREGSLTVLATLGKDTNSVLEKLVSILRFS